MVRWLVALCTFLSLAAFTAAQSTPANDAQAVALANNTVAALTGASVLSDVVLTGNVTRTVGSDVETGTATLSATSTEQAQVDLRFSGGHHTEVRTRQDGWPQGAWSKADGISHEHAVRNCWTDAAWFFPAFSSLAHASDENVLLTYVGQEERHGVSVYHLRAWRRWPYATKDRMNVPGLSAMDFYLDSRSLLPVAVAFHMHPDGGAIDSEIPAEIRFGDYHTVNGVQVPFHIERFLNNTLLLDINVTSAAFNTGFSAGK